MNNPIKHLIWKKHPEGSITQWFGENPALYARWGLNAHPGIDIVAPHGTPMYAVEDGIIIDVNNSPEGYGKQFRLRSLEANEDGYYRCWVYGHCSEIAVKNGDKVQVGTYVAKMGNTGFVVSGATPWWKTNPFAGTHLHLGVRHLKENPSGWKYKGDVIKYEAVNYGNGYKGYFDFKYMFKESSSKREKMLTIISLQNQLLSLLRKLKK